MDPYHLDRFRKAHLEQYDEALEEIRCGQKRTHWMWFVFPQPEGLGRSPTAQYYAIRSPEEAKAYLSDEYLGGHLREICGALVLLETDDPEQVFGYTDALKLRSCMTLFNCISEGEGLFGRILNKYYGGEPDPAVLDWIETPKRQKPSEH